MKHNILCNVVVICAAVIFAITSCALPAKNQTRYQIKQLAPDGTWTWFNDERVIVDGRNLLIGSVDSQGRSRIDLYDLLNHTQHPYPLSSWKSKDDHNNPAILKLKNGKILACYAQHNRQKLWYWRIADKKKNGLRWHPEKTFETHARTTYCNLAQLSAENNRIYNFSRNIGFNPNLQYSDDNAKT